MSENINKDLVEIKKFVKPDLIIVEGRKTYSSVEYYRMSFVFKENLVAEEQCDEDGVPTGGYRSVNYLATKIDGDDVIYMSPKYGWIVHEKATEEYHNRIAEKELLS